MTDKWWQSWQRADLKLTA